MLERAKLDEAITFRFISERVSHDVWGINNRPECRESVMQELLIHLINNVTHEEVGANVLRASVDGGLGDTNGLREELDHVEDFSGILCVQGGAELAKAIAEVVVRYTVAGDVHVTDGGGLYHELP